MQIFVKDRSRQNLSLRVLAGDTVWLAKVMIREAEGIPPESQRLIFNSKQLDDSRSLGSYGVVAGSNIFLTSTLGGGGNKKETFGVVVFPPEAAEGLQPRRPPRSR